MAEDDLPDDHRRLLDAFSYHWSKAQRTWVNREAGRAISPQTVRAWTLDDLRDWLTRDGLKK